ncbi:hypothetical protein VARIO8X_120067 [Burkholderiales bacterium 8X]|nr:hypothetical protein VARIO8X_120067 [Burkholderiales bacterium 8X]
MQSAITTIAPLSVLSVFWINAAFCLNEYFLFAINFRKSFFPGSVFGFGVSQSPRSASQVSVAVAPGIEGQ